VVFGSEGGPDIRQEAMVALKEREEGAAIRIRLAKTPAKLPDKSAAGIPAG
jgi:hypothetical protein